MGAEGQLGQGQGSAAHRAPGALPGAQAFADGPLLAEGPTWIPNQQNRHKNEKAIPYPPAASAGFPGAAMPAELSPH